MIYAVKNAAELNADCIIEKEDGTVYVCYLNPTLVNKLSSVPIEQQNAWKIEKITKTTSGDKTYLRTMYPNGQNNLYNFSPANCETYNYEYQK